MRKLLNTLVEEDDGHGTAIYALWVGVATAIVEPYLVFAVMYRIGDFLLLFANQLRTLSW